MSGQVKKVLVGLAAAGAIAIWAPRIMSAVEDSSPAARPDRGPEGEYAGRSSAPSTRESERSATIANSASFSAPEPGPSTPGGAGDEFDDLAPVIEALRTFVPNDRPVDLDRAASAVAMMGTQQDALDLDKPVPSTVKTPETASLEETTSGKAQASAPEGSVEDFMRESALTGILRDGESSVALLGGRIVRVGDEVADGQLIITSIEAESVRLRRTSPRSPVADHEVAVYRMELPAFRPVPGSRSEEEPSLTEPAEPAAIESNEDSE